jgi:hypothetical protein
MTAIAQDVEYSKSSEPDEPETRMKANMYGALSTKVQDVLKVSQIVQMEFRAGVRNKITR